MNKVSEIIKYYYQKLSFPNLFDEEFYNALDKIEISDTTAIKEYDKIIF